MIEGLHGLTEFAREGLTVTDKLDPADEFVAFRTVVLPDADICVMIDPRALDRPDFAERHTAHIGHVARELEALRARLRRWSRAATGLGATTITALIVGLGSSGGLLELLLGELGSVLDYGTAMLASAMLWPIGRWLLRLGVSRRQSDEDGERLAATIARFNHPG